MKNRFKLTIPLAIFITLVADGNVGTDGIDSNPLCGEAITADIETV